MITRSHASTSSFLALLATSIIGQACSDAQRPVEPVEAQLANAIPSHSLSSGTVSSLVGRSILSEGFKVKRKTGNWEMDIHAKDPVDVVVATIAIDAGGTMGWHTHPGPGFVQVTSGTARFYEADDPSCTPTVVTAGHAWLDRGEVTHVVRNETNSPLTLVVTLLIPPGSQPRIDEPAPGNCLF